MGVDPSGLLAVDPWVDYQRLIAFANAQDAAARRKARPASGWFSGIRPNLGPPDLGGFGSLLVLGATSTATIGGEAVSIPFYLREEYLQQKAFRDGLKSVIPKPRGRGWQAHHIIPKNEAFRALIEEYLGVGNDDFIDNGMINGSWWNKNSHQKFAKVYDRMLAQWIQRTNPTTGREILEYGRRLQDYMQSGEYLRRGGAPLP